MSFSILHQQTAEKTLSSLIPTLPDTKHHNSNNKRVAGARSKRERERERGAGGGGVAQKKKKKGGRETQTTTTYGECLIPVFFFVFLLLLLFNTVLLVPIAKETTTHPRDLLHSSTQRPPRQSGSPCVNPNVDRHVSINQPSSPPFCFLVRSSFASHSHAASQLLINIRMPSSEFTFQNTTKQTSVW